MHPPRFTHPNYMHQPQWRAHGPKFAPPWPRSNLPNHNPRALSNFQSNNEEYWCETCDRGFRASHLLEQHKQQHQKCNIDGCQFIAHPKVITKHIQMQHSTGLFKKIAILNNPEEIKKWRDERKRKYPTKENIEKKGAEIKEKIDRGERMGMKCGRENRPHQSEQARKRKYHSEHNNKQHFKRTYKGNKSNNELNKHHGTFKVNKKTTLLQRGNNIIPPMDESKTIKPFMGILHLVDDVDNEDSTEDTDNNMIDDDEYTTNNSSPAKDSASTEPVVCGALSLLIGSYESSDDESVHGTKAIHDEPQKHDNIAKQQNKPQKIEVEVPDHSENGDDSGPEETKIVKATDVDINTEFLNINNKGEKQTKHDNRTTKIEKRERNNIHKKNTAKFKSKLPSTLLEKLLHNEIRQERNIVLQCIRYIVKNNYFDNS